jgi:hypothetical protein
MKDGFWNQDFRLSKLNKIRKILGISMIFKIYNYLCNIKKTLKLI